MKTIGRAHRFVRSTGLGILRYMPKTRLAVRHAYWRSKGRTFDKMAATVQIDDRKVFFEAFGGRSFSCSPRALYLKMICDSRFDDYQFIWSFKGQRRVEENASIPELARAVIVQRGSTDYFDALASSKVIIQNNRLPEYVTPKESQIFVQCWHGTPLKRLGYDVEIETSNALNTTSELAERFGMDAAKWTYLLSPSPYTSEHLASAFGLPAERRDTCILEYGYPRNDELALARMTGAASMASIRGKLNIPIDKKVLLYAPTWRDDSYKAGVGYTFDYLIDFDKLRRALGNDWVVLFRPHYYIANSFDFDRFSGFVYDVSVVGDINSLYIAADVLVTDYSSVMFDYSILRRPMLFYVPDYEHYAGDIRGFYFDMSQVPGPLCASTDELADELENIHQYWNRYGNSYTSFTDQFCPLDDGHASERVLEHVFDLR